MTPFRHLLQDHSLWGIRRKTVVPAVAWGMFVALLPIPGHMLVAVLGSLVLRINIPIAALATLVVNPVTIGPIGAILISPTCDTSRKVRDPNEPEAYRITPSV